MQDKTRLCPNGHALVDITLPDGSGVSGSCDGCGKQVKGGDCGMICRQCDGWFLCRVCHPQARKDGRVDAMSAAVENFWPPSCQSAAETVFKETAADASRGLLVAELGTALAKLTGASLDDAQVRQIFSKFDADLDGRLSFQEYMKMIWSGKPKAAELSAGDRVEAVRDISDVQRGEPGTIISFSRHVNQKEVVDIVWDRNLQKQGVFKERWPADIRILSKAPRIHTCLAGHQLEELGTSKDDGWKCNYGLSGTCKSGITDYNQTYGMNRYRCAQCDFDVCQLCVQPRV